MNNKVSMRIAYGQALADYGEVNPDVVVLDADVSASTQTHYFAKRFPDRFFNLGVAEPGMVDVAAGLALGGKIPFANTFASILSLRAAEQVRTCVAYARTNVKLAAGYGGLSDSRDGPTHHSVMDIAVMRAMPGLVVVVAADATEARKLVPAVAEYDGPVYFRLSRAEVPLVFSEDHEVEIGKGTLLREGNDVTIIATGVMVARSLLAADALRRAGVGTRVVSLHTIKPLDRELVLASVELTGAVVTVEEHSIVGGLGGAVAELLSETMPAPVVRVGIRDTFTDTGGYEELLDRFGMSQADITAAAQRAISLKV